MTRSVGTPTARDVAREAGVTPMTVSRVLRGANEGGELEH